MDQHRVVPSLVGEKICSIAGVLPEAIALSCETSTMTYKELEQRSAHFAGYLRQRGVPSGSSVAICMERSFDWIIAALGILRAGSSYVPLDHAWSPARLTYAINDSGAALVVASAGLLDLLTLTVPGVDPHREAQAIAIAPPPQLESVSPTALAYLIYTSGSTGLPKGVEITHANLAHLVDWHETAFKVNRDDRVSHLAGLGFDAAVWEIWSTLAAGATLCIPDDSIRVSPDLLRDWLLAQKITVGFVPTALARTLIAKPWPMESSLRLLLTGGDVLPQAPIEGLPFQVANNYGPTESTVVATSGVVEPGLLDLPSIGREIAGTSIYLLDPQGQPVPQGTLGEIYIGGNGVAHGYRNLPELTQQYFLPDPFTTTPGARMYRSGDMAIRQADGTLRFRGRNDRQVKIRGQRVELDEIGSTLGRYPGIEFATALAVPSSEGDQQLVAYILPTPETTVPTMAALQEYLLESVPRYMVPSIFVRLQSLPLSANGKIDLALLERPDATNTLKDHIQRLPENPIEERVLSLLQQLLDTKDVTLDDDFFLVGGHSLIGMQLVLRIREAFGVNLTLKQLFQAPTAARLASTVESILIESISNLSDEEAGLQLAD